MTLKNLTQRQSEILQFIRKWQLNNGHPPTYAEIRQHFGFSSINAVRTHLGLIEKKGYIHMSPGKARGIQLVPLQSSPENLIPILGRIAAGAPILAEQNLEGYLSVPPAMFGGGEIFALQVVGDSMTGVGINNGDIAVIKKMDRIENGEIAAVLVENEATLKRVYLTSESITLKAENPLFNDLTFDLVQNEHVRILGRYQGIIRTMDDRRLT